MISDVLPQTLFDECELDNDFYENIEITTWSKSEKLFQDIDKNLYEILKELPIIDAEFPLVKISFPYGFTIYKHGTFYLPLGNKGSIPITSDKVSATLKKLLSYNFLPLSLVIKNGFEVFQESEDNVSPLAFRRKGLELGIWETVATASPYTVTSGARTFTILPKLTDHSNHKNLSSLGVNTHVPLGYFDFWEILKQISKKESKQWTCDVIFFTKNWYRKIETDKNWLKFNHYILKKALEHTATTRLDVNLNVTWNNFAKILTKKKIKINGYIVDTFKRLIYISAGLSPAFVPASSLLDVAPFNSLFNAYLEVYKLKTYIPTIMYTDNFASDTNVPYYYSLQASTCLQSTLTQKVSVSARKDLQELIYLKDLFANELSKNSLGAGSHIFYDLFSQVDFQFYHSEPSIDDGIYPSSDLLCEDERLGYIPEKYKNNRVFCDKSSFFRGCVKISKK